MSTTYEKTEYVHQWALEIAAIFPRDFQGIFAQVISALSEEDVVETRAKINAKKRERIIDRSRKSGWEIQLPARVALELVEQMGATLLSSPGLLAEQIFMRQADIPQTQSLFQYLGYDLAQLPPTGEKVNDRNLLKTKILISTLELTENKALIEIANAFRNKKLISPEKFDEFVTWVNSQEFYSSNADRIFDLNPHVQIVASWRTKSSGYKISYKIIDGNNEYRDKREAAEQKNRKQEQAKVLVETLADPKKVYGRIERAIYPLNALQGDTSSPAMISFMDLFDVEFRHWDLTYGELKRTFDQSGLHSQYRYVAPAWNERPEGNGFSRFKIVADLGDPVVINDTAERNMLAFEEAANTLTMPQAYEHKRVLGIYLVPSADCRKEIVERTEDELDKFVEGTLEQMITQTTFEKPIELQSLILELFTRPEVDTHSKRFGVKGLEAKAREVFARLVPQQFDRDILRKIEVMKAERLVGPVELGKKISFHWPYSIRFKDGNRSRMAEVWAIFTGSGDKTSVEYAFGKCL